MDFIVFPHLIESLRKSLVATGILTTLLVLTGPLQSVSLQPEEAQAQVIGICSDSNPNPSFIVQDCDTRAAGFAGLESQVLDDLLSLHRLPESDRGRLRTWERNAVRAGMFENLITIIQKDPGGLTTETDDDRTPTEQNMVDAIADLVTERRIAAAQYSIDQYNAWNASPCTYQAPHGFTYDRDNAWCDIDIVKTFRGPIPPSLEDFLHYGFADIYKDFKTGGAAELISGETARLMGVIVGLVAVGIAAAVGAKIGASLAVGLGIIHAIHPFMAATVGSAANHVAISSVAGAASGGVGALSIGAVAAIIVLAIVIIVIQAITVVAQTQIPVQLQEGLNQAQAGVNLRALAQSDGGKAEIYAAFILSTIPDFPNNGSVPAAQATDRTFVVTDAPGNRTHSQTINYQCWNPAHCQGEDLEHTARIHEGWFVDKSDDSGIERMTLGIDYINWDGEGWTASRIGPQKFLHSRTGDDDAEDFVSEEIKFRDAAGANLTAVLNHPPTDPPRPVADHPVNNGTFELNWPPASTDPDGDSVTYTLFRCDANTVEFVNDVAICDLSAVASGLTSTTYAFTEGAPENAGLFRYYAKASDGRLESSVFAPLSVPILVDKQPPVISLVARAPAANAYGWNNTDVTVEWSCSDTSAIPEVPPSGVVFETVSETVETEGHNQSVEGICADKAGNIASNTVEGISIDKIAPIPLFDGPYVVDEGSSIQLSSVNSTDALSGIASAAFALDGDDQFDDGDPATFNAIEGTTFPLVKLRVEDRAGNVAIAQTAVTILNVEPTIEEIVTNGPVRQGESVYVRVNASDPGILDTLTYAFDCANDGTFEIQGASNLATCALDPAIATTTIGVRVSDDDGGMTSGTVDVVQTLTLCVHTWTMTLRNPGVGGSCGAGTIPLLLSALSPTTLCVNVSSRELTWKPAGSCSAGQIAHAVPASGPLAYCANTWNRKIRARFGTGSCSAVELPGVIPG